MTKNPLKWYRISNKKPKHKTPVLVASTLESGIVLNVGIGKYTIDERGIAFWDMQSRAWPNVTQTDYWAEIDLTDLLEQLQSK